MKLCCSGLCLHYFGWIQPFSFSAIFILIFTFYTYKVCRLGSELISEVKLDTNLTVGFTWQQARWLIVSAVILQVFQEQQLLFRWPAFNHVHAVFPMHSFNRPSQAHKLSPSSNWLIYFWHNSFILTMCTADTWSTWSLFPQLYPLTLILSTKACWNMFFNSVL